MPSLVESMGMWECGWVVWQSPADSTKNWPVLSYSRSLKHLWLSWLCSTMNNPLPSKFSGNVHFFAFYETMYFILFYVESSTQRKLPGPQKGVISGSLKFLMHKDGREFLLQKIDIPRELIEDTECNPHVFLMRPWRSLWNLMVLSICYRWL